MERIGSKLQKQGVIMALFTLGLIHTGCEEHFDCPQVSVDEKVNVSLSIGFADEVDGYTLSTSSSTKSVTKQGVFDYDLQPSLQTKSLAYKPDNLYNLEIVQYDSNGNYKARAYFSGSTSIGSYITAGLETLTDCQLVVVAWGDGNAKTLGTTNLATAQTVSLEASVIKNLDPAVQSDMNKMPYVLHLEHVNVIKDSENGIISSPEGKDVRLLLRRLASRLTLEWSYSYTDYTLKQILLESIPLNYNVVAMPDENKTYPSLLDQFTIIQLTETEIKNNSYSCWIPANVRGISSSATSQTYRIKSNAPIGSAYASFIAIHKTENKKKLNYRVYLGCNNSSDFNLYSNTDYNYTVNIAHTDLPTNDRRVMIIDPIPASENNENFIPTANCFMVAPGSAFCFDPFKYQIKGNNNNVNPTLKEWVGGEGGIAYVRVLWQTKENGDLGDPVLGVVNSGNDHTNVVDIKMIGGGDVSAESLVTDINQAYIYCRVAPNTTGGSGAIAAYNKSNQILWSWHIWVTDYNPDSRGNEDVQTPVNKRKLKFEYQSSSFLPMMDRNLGAAAGYIDFPPNELEKSKTNGFYYQWGRKDPFIGSYSNTKIEKIPYTEIKKDAPTKGLLSLFEGDGITFHPTGLVQRLASYRDVYKDPGNMYKGSSSTSWISSQTDEYKNAWGGRHH